MTRRRAKKALFCEICKTSNDKIVDKIYDEFEDILKENIRLEKDLAQLKTLFDSEYDRCSCGSYKRRGFGCSCGEE